MTSTSHICPRKKRGRVALLAGVIFIFLAAVVFVWGYVMECEYPFWPTLWIAEQTKTPDGRRVTDLIRSRSGGPSVQQHWHHCTWCDVVYPHAEHLAVKVTINEDETNFYLFDWHLAQLKLLPITMCTAKLFPELIPPGCVIEPLGLGLNPQLYHDDEPCRVKVAQPGKLNMDLMKKKI